MAIVKTRKERKVTWYLVFWYQVSPGERHRPCGPREGRGKAGSSLQPPVCAAVTEPRIMGTGVNGQGTCGVLCT